MGEGTGRHVVSVPGDGLLSSLFAAEVRRKGLPVDLRFVESTNGHSSAQEPPIAGAVELSVTAARSAAGEIRTYPAAEILRETGLTIVPARISPALAAAAEAVARKSVEESGVVGVVEVSLEVNREDAPRILGVSPRPEPSGHYTLDACRTSQYEQHLRALAGMMLGETTLLYAAVSATITGAAGIRGPFVFEGVDGVRSIPGAFVHLYDVKESAPGRPLGQVTLVGVNDPGYRDALIHRAEHARRMIVQKESKK